MIHRAPNAAVVAGLVLCLAISPALLDAQQTRTSSVAVLEIVNAGLDPRLDYLSGIIGGLLSFDLGGRSDIALVDRRNMDAVLREKELSLSALGSDASAAAAAGRLVGADWLLTGEYVFMGSDVLLTLSLTDAATAARVVFRDRGGDENLVHRLAEQIVRRLTGGTVAFVEKGKSRSLVSLRDESPGSIALFSPIIRAEVFLDGEFVGYTTGDVTKAFVIEGVSPGEHAVRVHLDRNFGVIDMPEVRFRDWEGTARVESGKRSTLRDGTRHFNETLSRLAMLGSENVKAAIPADDRAELDPKLRFVADMAYTDRSGAEIAIRLEAKPRRADGTIYLDLSLSAGPKGGTPQTSSLSLRLPKDNERTQETEGKAGSVKLSIDADRYSTYWSIDWRVDRTDIFQNMWNE